MIVARARCSSLTGVMSWVRVNPDRGSEYTGIPGRGSPFRSIASIAIDPIVSYPAPPAAPSVVMRARCRRTSRHQGGSFVPPWMGGTWRHTPAAGGACGGLALAARETRISQCEFSRAAFPRLALRDRSTLAHAWGKREGLSPHGDKSTERSSKTGRFVPDPPRLGSRV